ncbi:hypothetical protein AAG906_020565 [Vitis piasezkii]
MGDNYGATIADCVDSKSIETSNREMLDLYDDDENDREFIVNELDGTVDPYVGMEFESEEAAMVYYDAYAKRVGFIIRVGNCHRSGRDGSVISRRAMIMVRKDKSGKWIVTKLETEHCHPLGIPPEKVAVALFRRDRRSLGQEQYVRKEESNQKRRHLSLLLVDFPRKTPSTRTIGNLRFGVNLEKSEVIQSGWGTIWKCSPDELCSGAAGKVQLKKLKGIYVSDIYPGIIAVQHTAGQIGMFHIFIILQPAYLKLIFFTSLIMIVIPSKLGLMLLVSMKIDLSGTSMSSPATLVFDIEE